jgi:hypothetical protein
MQHKRKVPPATIRLIASQVRKLSDAEVFALTYSSDRNVRVLAEHIAHQRAERYAYDNS